MVGTACITQSKNYLQLQISFKNSYFLDFIKLAPQNFGNLLWYLKRYTVIFKIYRNIKEVIAQGFTNFSPNMEAMCKIPKTTLKLKWEMTKKSCVFLPLSLLFS